MLQISSGNDSKNGGHNAKSSETRRRFLEAYEKTFGNVDKSCQYAGISRQTYYRWKKSKSSVNLRFQRRIEQIRPRELLLDLAESSLMKLVDQGNVRAAIYLLRTKGQSRGWGTSPPPKKIEAQAVARKVTLVKSTFQMWVKENPRATTNDRRTWLIRFAELADLPSSERSQLDGLY